MARDNVPIVIGAINADNLQGAGVAITVANGANVLAAGVTDNLVLLVQNTFAGAKILTIRAGVYPPAFRNQGDLTISLTQAFHYVFLEAARFVQADGSINLDYEAAMTGTVWCIKLPPELY
jgi:hypothetical protein